MVQQTKLLVEMLMHIVPLSEGMICVLSLPIVCAARCNCCLCNYICGWMIVQEPKADSPTKLSKCSHYYLMDSPDPCTWTCSDS